MQIRQVTFQVKISVLFYTDVTRVLDTQCLGLVPMKESQRLSKIPKKSIIFGLKDP